MSTAGAALRRITPDQPKAPVKICVIGGGISGLAASHYLSEGGEHQVTILEAAPLLGGRANVADDGGVELPLGVRFYGAGGYKGPANN